MGPSPVLTAPHPCQAGKQDTRQEEKGEKTHPQENDYIVFYKPETNKCQCWSVLAGQTREAEQRGGQVGAILPEVSRG